MSEERKGTPIEKWDAVKGQPDDNGAMADYSKDKDGKSIGERFIAMRESTGMNRMEFSEYLVIGAVFKDEHIYEQSLSAAC